MAFVNPNYYGFSASAVIILADFESDCERDGGSKLECYTSSGDYMLNIFGFNTINPYENILVWFKYIFRECKLSLKLFICLQTSGSTIKPVYTSGPKSSGLYVVKLNHTSTIGTQTSFLGRVATIGKFHCSGFHANINYVQKFASHKIVHPIINSIPINLTSIDTTGNDNCFPGACWSL